MKKLKICFLAVLSFLSSGILSQTTSHKDLIGTTWVLMDRGNQKETWEFLDSTNLYDRSYGEDNKPISRKLKYRIDKDTLKLNSVGSNELFRYKISFLNEDEFKVTFLNSELFDEINHKWIEQEPDKLKEFVLLKRQK